MIGTHLEVVLVRPSGETLEVAGKGKTAGKGFAPLLFSETHHDHQLFFGVRFDGRRIESRPNENDFEIAEERSI